MVAAVAVWPGRLVSVFDDQQLIMGLPGMIVRRALTHVETTNKWASLLVGERRDNDLYLFRPLNSVIPYVQLGVRPCVELLCMRCAVHLPLSLQDVASDDASLVFADLGSPALLYIV